MQGLDVGISKIGAQGNITLLKVKGYVDTTTSTELYGMLSKLLNTMNIKLILILFLILKNLNQLFKRFMIDTFLKERKELLSKML